MTRDQALRVAWNNGWLSYYLYDYQLVLYHALWAAIQDPNCLKFVLNCSRRWGKTTVLCLIAIEFAIRHPGSQIRFAAPTAKALKKITRPIFGKILKGCPPHLR